MNESEQGLIWGIIGTGHMASRFVEALSQCKDSQLGAVAGRDQERTKAFLRERQVDPNKALTLEQMLQNESVRAVYISTPHPHHLEGILAACKASKHVLCEKPLTLNHGEALVAAEAGEQTESLIMEGYMYRSHQQTRLLLEMIGNGKIGELRSISASFSFNVLERSDNPRLTEPTLGGGAILDLGCYPLSFSRLVAGAALGQSYANPVALQAHSTFTDTGVDLDSIATLIFEEGITAQISCGLDLQRENSLRVYGSKGRLELPTPWSPGREGEASFIRFIPSGHVTGEAETESTEVIGKQWLLSQQINCFAEAISRRQLPYPAMTMNESISNMLWLDRWRKAAGASYPGEQWLEEQECFTPETSS